MTGPRFEFARALAEEHARAFAETSGPCSLCGRRRAAALYCKVLTRSQAKRLGTGHRRGTVAFVGLCSACEGLVDLQARLEAGIEGLVDKPAAAPVLDLGDLPLPDCLTG